MRVDLRKVVHVPLEKNKAKMFVERRKHQRFYAEIPIQYSLVKDPKEAGKVAPTSQGHTIDISEGGVFMAIQDPVPPSQVLKIFLPVVHEGKKMTLEIYGEVLRAQPDVCAIRFLDDPDPKVQEALRAYLEKLKDAP